MTIVVPTKKIDIPKASVVIGFALLYAIISFVNHYLFRTNAFDYGIYNQALWDYAHFRVNNNTVLEPSFGNLLGDHFEVIMMLIAPLYYVFGAYTLLIVQVAALLIGGQGIYKYVEYISGNRKLAMAAMIHFFLFFGIYSSLAFDYHNNVVGAMAVPWIFYFIKKNYWKQTIIAFIIFLISKENMALWGFFIFIGLMIQYRKERKKVIISAILALVSISYFLFIAKCLIPSFGKYPNGYLDLRYASLGNNFSDIISNSFSHPLNVLKLLFVNQTGVITGNYIKTELHLAVMFSGGILLIYRPYYLLMLIPIYAQKLFCNIETYWGLGYHYSVEFIPVITIGAFSIINEFTQEKTRRIVVYTLIILTAAVTFHSMDHTYTYFCRQKQRFYQNAHYSREFDVAEAYSALKIIPGNASVSAQDELLPHLCFRKNIYLYPHIEDAEYVVLSSKASFYPFAKENEYAASIVKLDTSKAWEKIYNKNFMQIFKRKTK